MSDLTDKLNEVTKEFEHRMRCSRARLEPSEPLRKKYGKQLDALQSSWDKNARASLAIKEALLEELRPLNRKVEAEALY